MKLRIASCMTLPEPDADAAPLAAALAAAGIDATVLAWDDPAADWEAAIPTLIRSTWNYALSIDAFLAWVDRASRAAPMLNPPNIVRANVRKRYLLELAERGVPVVPTQLARRGDAVLGDARRFVIKPEVGAASLGARVFHHGEVEAVAHLVDLTQDGACALIQPYIDSVETYGERSLIWIDGELTHAIRKNPRFAGQDERVDGPMPMADDEIAVARAALAPYTDRILYGRVDMARDAGGRPMVMELELVEPSLFFWLHPPALDRFVRGLVRQLGG